jgi:molecular chaperone IbpA
MTYIHEPFRYAEPSIRKASIGFDSLFQRLNYLVENTEKQSAYPPYNIKSLGNDKYSIEIAVAGFTKDDIEVILENNYLHVTGSLRSEESKDIEYIYKGIADRAFIRKFTLADMVEVRSVFMDNGMLVIVLERNIPEEKKPKRIEIQTFQPNGPSKVTQSI